MKREEDNIQRAVVAILSLYENMGKLRYFAIPNGGKRSKIEAGIMKGLGVRAGVADLCIMITHGPTLFIEMKTPEGRTTTEQRDFAAWVNKYGGGRTANVCRTVEEVHAIVKDGFAQAGMAA